MSVYEHAKEFFDSINRHTDRLESENTCLQERIKYLEGLPNKSVLQPWVCDLTFMKQSVLMSAVRGPDTLHKRHSAKDLLRWYRRCIFYSAFEKKIFTSPFEQGGGSFTGPCNYTNMIDVVENYMMSLDEVPHHFHMHLIHAVEILGYDHPNIIIREFWNMFYFRLVNDLHLRVEPKEDMNRRLGDNEEDWKKSEGRWDMKRTGNDILDYREDGE